ncbi:MAG: hypothetical protein ABSH08_12485 [Tepidisphaeraceae bacterium]
MNRAAIADVSSRSKWLALAACAGLLTAFWAIASSAWLGKSAAFDEPFHFIGAWVQTHYGDFRCNPEDPPLWKYYVAAGTSKNDLPMDWQSPLWNRMLDSIPAASVLYSDKLLYQSPGIDADKLLRAAHQRMVLLGVALGAAIAWWAWRLRGPLAAVVATAAFCFDPNFLAHSPIIKNDVPITLVFLLLMGAIWLLGQRATPLRCAAVVLLAGVALTTKFSGLLAIPVLAIALVCRSVINRPWPFLNWTLPTRRRRFSASLGLLVASILFGYFAIWACYGFRFGPSSDPSVKFDFKQPILDIAENEMQLRQDPVPAAVSNAQLAQWVDQWKPDAIVRIGKVVNEHHLLPQAWLFGFLYTYGTSLARRAFLCGQIRVQGWWYYFPLAMLFKTPLATLIGLMLAVAFWIGSARRSAEARDRWAVCALVVAPIFYLTVAMRGNLNIGLRHVFPVYPFLFISLGIMAAQAHRRSPKLTRVVLVLLFAGLIAETVAAYPDYLPFFNVAAGGSRGGLRLLSDSNLDWGQDLPALARWQREHPDRQLYLCQFALPDPRYYGIHYVSMPGAYLEQEDEKATSGLPPVYAISAVALQGTYMPPELQRDIYDRFLKTKPFEVLDGTIYLFNPPPP